MSTPVRASRDVIIRSDTFEAAIRFYETVLGLPIVRRDASMVGFDAGAFRLYVERGPSHGPVFDFLVPEMHAAKQSLVAGGCTVVEEDASVPRCYLRDPFGLVFNIDERKPTASAAHV
jgi:predicted enzyme related to lactoylglutathione lyase